MNVEGIEVGGFSRTVILYKELNGITLFVGASILGSLIQFAYDTIDKGAVHAIGFPDLLKEIAVGIATEFRVKGMAVGLGVEILNLLGGNAMVVEVDGRIGNDVGRGVERDLLGEQVGVKY